ncbi:TetR/AcrR family transcriptional regulator [Kitasatospora sp. NPDC094015]|uniref:TetR/AcrR family transcriptional regulator n=1 Tax=Kitasatospora sp. NPDC094015 TaxID=3155205 RepID=UPI0033339638
MSRSPEPLRGPADPLPVAGQAPPERADAARNRLKILRAAAEILDAAGPEGLSVAEVARVADTGVGTVYRRFGDRTGLLLALLDEREREFQAAFMSGPPPLGPGAPDEVRLRAFLSALVDRIQAQHELALLAERSSPAGRLRSGRYSVHHAHLSILLARVRPGADPHFLADTLLAALSAEQLRWFREGRGMDPQQIKDAVRDLVDGLCGGPGTS